MSKMLGQDELVLYDIGSKGPNRYCFSPNVWKTRAVLNYKNIPYRTHWVLYTDLAAVAQTWNVPPNTPQEAMFPYSVPCIRLPPNGPHAGEHVMESLRIAHKLETLYPEPSLRLDTDHHTRALDVVTRLQMALVPPYVYRMVDTLPEEDGELLTRERTRQFGRSPADLAADPEISGEKAWEKAKDAIQTLKEFLAENSSGPFVMGKEVSFADFVIVGGTKCFDEVDRGGDVAGRLRKEVGEDLVELEKACEEWFRRKTY